MGPWRPARLASSELTILGVYIEYKLVKLCANLFVQFIEWEWSWTRFVFITSYIKHEIPMGILKRQKQICLFKCYGGRHFFVLRKAMRLVRNHKDSLIA